MPAIDASNPSLAPSNMAQREYDALDVLLMLRDIQDGAETTTAAETPILFKVEKIKTAAIVINQNAIGGTVDSSNYWTITVTAADNQAMSSPTTLYNSGNLTAAKKQIRVPLEGKAAELMRTAGESESVYIRVTATETGTTAGNLTYGAYITCN